MKKIEELHETTQDNKIHRRGFLRLGILAAFAGLSVAIIDEKPTLTNKNNSNKESTLGEHENKPNPITEDFIKFVEKSYKTESALDPKIISCLNQPLIFTKEGNVSPILFTIYNKEGLAVATYAIYTDNKSGININNEELPNELKILEVQENVNQLGTSNVNINKDGVLVDQNYIAIGVPAI